MPQLKQLLNEHREASQTLDQAKNNAELAEKQHIQIGKRHEESQKLQSNLSELTDKIQQGQKEAASIEKHILNLRETAKNKDISLQKKMSIEKEISELKSQHNDLQKQHVEAVKIESKIDDLTAQISKHRNEIPKIEDNIVRIRETANKKNISLQQKVIAEKELKQLRKQLSETKSKLSDATTGLRKAWLVAKTIYKAGKKLI